MSSRSLKRVLGVAACTTGLVVASAGMASAGEIRGTGVEKPPVGKSICAYSGLNDGYVGFGGSEPQRTQSYGQIVRLAGSLGGAGQFCNPNNPPPPEG